MVEDKADRLDAVLDFAVGASMLLLEGGGQRDILSAIASHCADRLDCYAAIYLRAAGSTAVAVAGRPDYLAALSGATCTAAQEIAARELALVRLHCEPAFAGGREIGALLLAAPQNAPLGDVLEKLARAIAATIGAAVARAESNATQQRIADRLQRALLPTLLPILDGVKFDVAYRPATQESEVGGDWYDAFDLEGQRIGISVGDVVGHGLDAAVAMGETRRALRMAAVATTSPMDLLTSANTVLSREDGAVMATAIVGYYDTATRTFTYACAGHPPPILAIDGRAYLLPGGGLPLGIDPYDASRNWTITLPPNSSIYFYTDGLLEYGRDIIAGERRLAAAIEQTASMRTENAAALLHDTIFDGIANTDDAATLVLHAIGQRVGSLRGTYSATPEFAKISRAVLSDILRFNDVDPTLAENILYATGEAVANAIEHGANGDDETFLLEVDVAADHVGIVVESNGHWKAFASHDNERGRGLPIMQALATDVRLTSAQNATRIHLTFSIA